MRVVINGEAKDFEELGSVKKILNDLGLDLRGMAVALDGEVIPRSDWEIVIIREGQRIEIVRAVQGGQ